ncbi:integrase arm-type DNA-binding domain-containing protein [Pectobacteriaceae bacterium CE90]|nr:integrase arm-type DNA-binding domain-containing protein [Pectobacteriaceae bacterium CE90]
MNDDRNTPLFSAVAVQKSKSVDKDYDLTNGHGLTLSIRTAGKKIWYFRYQRPSYATRTNITLGHYPAMTLPALRVPFSMNVSRCW